jgi:hypothetical protein
LVTGEPSRGIATLKVCVSLRMAEGFSSTFAGFAVESADRARRFFGSWRIVWIKASVLAPET